MRFLLLFHETTALVAQQTPKEMRFNAHENVIFAAAAWSSLTRTHTRFVYDKVLYFRVCLIKRMLRE